jgi:putative hydrolase of the HAD superfamily
VKLPRAQPGTALLLDAAGTLLRPAEPVAETYARHARARGLHIDAKTIASRFAAAMTEAAPLRRGATDWRPYWQFVVQRCTGSDEPELLDGLIHHFAAARAWTVAPGAAACCTSVRARGMKVAVVSNWDHHLRPLLTELGVSTWIDLLVVSAEEGLEKPDAAIFQRACARLEVAPARAVHVGDDPQADIEGAQAAGCTALLIGRDVADFAALARMLGS